MSMRLTISVAMAVYNGEKYLRDQLDSIAAQTRLPDELVISDDGSTDRTVEIAAEFATAAPFTVRVKATPQRVGVVRNFEKAISDSTGEIIFLCDQDDFWRPDKVEWLTTYFETDPGVGLVFTDALLVDSKRRPLSPSLFHRYGVTRSLADKLRQSRADEELLARWFVTGATCAIRRDVAKLAIPFPTAIPGVIHDRWLAITAYAVSRIEAVFEPLVEYRQHSAQQIGAAKLSTARAVRDKASLRTSQLHNEILLVDEVQRRFFDVPAARRLVNHALSRKQHLRFRQSLPAPRFRRVCPVIRQLVALRYHRHSNGLLSVLKDLIR